MYTISTILLSLKEFLDSMLDESMYRDIKVVLDSVKKDKVTGEGDLVITLLRIEEETSRKPQNIYFYDKENDVERQTSPDLDINLEVLISAPSTNYETALVLISHVVSILNSVKTCRKPKKMTDESFEVIDAMHISLMGMSFDQTLSMWQTLGGPLVPAVAYKIRMVTVPGLCKEDFEVPMVGPGRFRVEMGGVSVGDEKPEPLTEQEQNELTLAQERKMKQEEYARQVAEKEAADRESAEKEEKERRDKESKRSIQIREK